MLHHYTEYLEESVVREAEYEALNLLAEYDALEKQFPRKGMAIGEEVYPDLFPAF